MDTQTLVDEEIINMRLAGESTRSIANSLNRQKLYGPKGGTWNTTLVLRRLPRLGLSRNSPGVFYLPYSGAEKGSQIEVKFRGRSLKAVVLDHNSKEMLLRSVKEEAA